MHKLSRTPLFWWLLGAAVGVGVASSLPEGESEAARPLALGGSMLVFGALGQLLIRSQHSEFEGESDPLARREPLVPDGRIEIQPISTGFVEPNRSDGRFGRYIDMPKQENGPTLRRAFASRSRLTGRVIVSTIFVGSEYQPWSDDEVARSLRKVERACRWLEREAMRWGASLKLEIAGGYFAFPNEPFVEPDISLADQGHDLGLVAVGEWEWILKGLNRSLSSFGSRDFVTFITDVEATFADADEVVWLVFPRQAGRSFALPRNEEAFTAGANLAVCYAIDANLPEPLRGAEPRVNPATIAHEFLHLFHASDKYGKRLDRFARGTVTRSDIMRLSPNQSFRSQRVDPATAREIGWA